MVSVWDEVERLEQEAQQDSFTGARFREVLSRVSMPDRAFEVIVEAGRPSLRCFAFLTDNTLPITAPKVRQNGRWWRLSPHMTDGEILQTALMAVLAFEEHEIREKFKVDGVSVFDPHYDIEALIALRQSPGGGLKERTHGPA